MTTSVKNRGKDLEQLVLKLAFRAYQQVAEDDENLEVHWDIAEGHEFYVLERQRRLKEETK